MGQALYRKYRSKSLSEVVGQEHITDSLQHALKTGKLAHAYLFTGPRGVGKTSIARILAHEINNLPYADDSSHMDIIEIDAASNRRIDEIRELRDKVNVAPSSAKYKVYIIDEVHMLTREAFNALLKTLEEPPAHAVFILATTESHKLPETIVSRTQRFIFRPVSQDKVVAHLRTIASQEDLTIDDEALELIAGHGEGSFRDSISLLDQTRGHDGAVDASYVRSLIGVPTTEAIDILQADLASADVAALCRTLTSLRSQGFAAPQIAKQLAKRLRSDVLDGKATAGIFELMGKLLEVPVAHNPETYLELTLLSHALAGQLPAAAAPATAVYRQPATTPSQADQSAQSEQPSQTSSQPDAAATVNQPVIKLETAKLTIQPQPEQLPAVPEPVQQQQSDQPAEIQQLREPISVDENLWPEILNSLKKTHNTLYGIARMARANFYEDGLELGFTFSFHKRRFSEIKNKDVVINIIKSLTGREMAVNCVMVAKDAPFTAPALSATSTTPAPAMATAAASPDISAISNIFGGAEVLES